MKEPWVCLDCKFRDERDACICPEMYENTSDFDPEHGLFICCRQGFTACNYKEVKV